MLRLDSFQLLLITVLLGAFVWSWFETRLSITLAHRLGLLAPVTPRSAHRVPTPTIGGMAIADTVLIIAVIRGSGCILSQPWRSAR